MAGSKDDPTANEYATEANEKRQVVKTRKRKTMGIVAVVTILLALGLTLGLYFGLRKSDDGGNNNNNNDDGEDKGHLLLRKNDSKADPKYQNPGTGNPGTGPALQGTPGDNSTKWLPQAGTTWQIAIHDAIKIDLKKPSIQPANVNVFDIDLYTNDAKTIAALHSLGKRVICYFSAGSYEPYRPDSKLFNKKSIGATMDGWEDENWVDIRSDNIRKIMAARIKLASEKKCDGIDPDNMDGYNNVNGLGLKPKDTIEYVKFLADEAKKYNLALGLKNAGEVVESVLGMVDFAVNEQCEEYTECETFAPFIKIDKAVFHVEYPDSAPKVSAKTVNEICSQKGKAKGTQKFSTVIKSMNLSGWTQYCNGVTATTSLQ